MRLCFAFCTLWLMWVALSNAEEFKIVCYYNSRGMIKVANSKMDISDIDPRLCTHLVFMSIGISEDGNVRLLYPYATLPEETVNTAFQSFDALRKISPGLKTLVATGGEYEFDATYSKVVADASLRTKYVKNVVDFVLRHKFDGFSIDWLYPNERRDSPDDASNFVLLLEELRKSFDEHKLILSASVGGNKNQIKASYNIPEMSKYLDMINIMAWFVIPHVPYADNISPLYPAVRETAKRMRINNVNWTVNYWLSQGAPAEKIILGSTTHGQSFVLNRSTEHVPRSPSSGPGIKGAWYGQPGYLDYKEICKFVSQDSWTTAWDEEQRVPYAYSGNQWIAFENVRSITEKARYVKSMGLGGVMIYTIDRDDHQGNCGERSPLLKASNCVLRSASSSFDICDSDENARKKSPNKTTAATATSTLMPAKIPSTSFSTTGYSCSVPPQPENGKWSAAHFCPDDMADCTIPQNASLKPGTKLVFSCAPGYRTSGHVNVYCQENGNWSHIPVCIELKCQPLSSVSTTAYCSYSDKKVSCDFPVTPGTRAEVSCRLGYKKETGFGTIRREIVYCTENEKWEPEPIRCVPICGVAITRQTPNVIGGTLADTADFPWHASLYLQKINEVTKETSKKFICGATIIHTNFLMTAAHCVCNEDRVPQDPRKLFVMTGNIFRDFDHTGHNNVSVKRGLVKTVYVHSNYYGLTGNYASDIALLELQQPFELSNILSPACLDIDGYSWQILEPGARGKVAGFGRTATGPSSGILQTLTVPYVSYTQCMESSDADKSTYLISNDKFCAGYTNGMSVCDGDSGGGLVFQRNELWYVMGIVSVSLGVDSTSGARTCNKYSYTLYTKVSDAYIQWIQDIISHLEKFRS